MKTVVFLILIVFAVFGLSEFLHTVKLFIIFPKRRLYSHLVVNLQNSTAEKQIQYVCEQYVWHGASFADFIVPCAQNLDDNTRERCRQIAKKYGLKFDL